LRKRQTLEGKMAQTVGTIKSRSKFQTSSWAYRLKLLRNMAGFIRHGLPLGLRYLAGGLERPPSFIPHPVGRDFFGINVAASLSKALEDYHLERLRELGVSQVRTDYAYASDPEPTERWIERLCTEGFEVLVHLVQDCHDASKMDQKESQERWVQFLHRVFARFRGKVRLYEVGSTPNRHSWSGYSISDYVAAFSLARQVAKPFGVELIGPNIEDFAPYYLAALLAELRRAGIRLSFVTDNLFVDRAGAPETYDRHVLSSLLASVHRLDLARKSYFLDLIAKANAMGPPICSYAYWTINPRPSKPRRRYVTEQQHANHLVRYFVYAAAAGHLRRVYWGQMSGFFKGIINDGAPLRFDPPAVYQRLLNAGSVENYRLRLGFGAFRVMVERLADTRFVQKMSAGENGAYVFEFEKQGRPFWVAWTTSDCSADFSAVCPGCQVERVVDRDGNDAPRGEPILLTEEPLYLYPAQQ
jgi:hypothetical protein